jgi:type VI protein secretion system component VasA
MRMREFLEVVAMCVSEYDLVCDRCRQRFDEIFSVEAKSVEEEREQYQRWLNSLCDGCRTMLREEGFIE